MRTFSIDGKICRAEDATISVMDHGLLYGDGVFEGLRFYDSRIFRVEAHLNRLEDSATAIGLNVPMSQALLLDAMQEAIASSNLTDGYIRLVITRGSGLLGLDPKSCASPRTIIIVDELALIDPRIVAEGISIMIASTRRLSADQIDPRIKSLNYLNQILAKQEAAAAGADEAILLNLAGRIAEGSADNVFIVKDGLVKTPPTSEGALDGITRQAILDLCGARNIPAIETPLATTDLYTADEIFLTGTGAELIPVARVSGKKIPDKRPVFEALSLAFKALVRNPDQLASC